MKMWPSEWGRRALYHSFAQIRGLTEKSEKFQSTVRQGVGLCHILNPKRGNPYRSSIHWSSSMSETGKVIMKSQPSTAPHQAKGSIVHGFFSAAGGNQSSRNFLCRLDLTGGLFDGFQWKFGRICRKLAPIYTGWPHLYDWKIRKSSFIVYVIIILHFICIWPSRSASRVICCPW